MRVNNAKLTARNADRSKRTAKRAVLFALVVASASTVNAQQTSGVQHSPFFQSGQTGSDSHDVKKRVEIVTPQVRGVQGNPFFQAFQPSDRSVGRPIVQVEPVPTCGLRTELAAAAANENLEFRTPVQKENAFERQRQRELVGLPEVTGDVGVTPVPIRSMDQPSAAQKSDDPMGLAKLITKFQADSIDTRVDSDPMVVPVADSQGIKGESSTQQPVFLSLSDDGPSTPPLEEPIRPPMKKLAPMMVESAPVNPVDVLAKDLQPEPKTDTEPVAEPQAESVDSKATAIADGPVHQPESHHQPESQEQMEEGKEDNLNSTDPTGEVSAAPILVKLAPVIKLAQESPKPDDLGADSDEENGPALRELSENVPSLVQRKSAIVIAISDQPVS